MLNDEDAADVATEAEHERTALARAVREFDAAQARIEKNAERVYDEKRRGLVLELLPVLDNLDRTLEATKPTSDASGQRFDPKLHEAVAAVPVQDPTLVGTVVSQSAPGYRFGGRVLRAAKVSVGVQSPLVPSHAPGRAVPMTFEPPIFARLRRG